MVIAVEGNLSSGKSSFLALFRELEEDVAVAPEPVEKWTSGENLLRKAYEDPRAYAFPFQVYAQVTLAQRGSSAPVGSALVEERTLFR